LDARTLLYWLIGSRKILIGSMALIICTRSQNRAKCEFLKILKPLASLQSRGGCEFVEFTKNLGFFRNPKNT
jgi:hypothetical protein